MAAKRPRYAPLHDWPPTVGPLADSARVLGDNLNEVALSTDDAATAAAAANAAAASASAAAATANAAAAAAAAVAAGAVPTSRTLTTTSPLSIGGTLGATADLSANRTIALGLATNSGLEDSSGLRAKVDGVSVQRPSGTLLSYPFTILSAVDADTTGVNFKHTQYTPTARRTHTLHSSPATDDRERISIGVGSGNAIKIVPSSGTIDGQSAAFIWGDYSCIEVVYNGSEWRTVDRTMAYDVLYACNFSQLSNQAVATPGNTTIDGLQWTTFNPQTGATNFAITNGTGFVGISGTSTTGGSNQWGLSAPTCPVATLPFSQIPRFNLAMRHTFLAHFVFTDPANNGAGAQWAFGKVDSMANLAATQCAFDYVNSTGTILQRSIKGGGQVNTTGYTYRTWAIVRYGDSAGQSMIAPWTNMRLDTLQPFGNWYPTPGATAGTSFAFAQGADRTVQGLAWGVPRGGTANNMTVTLEQLIVLQH